MPTHRNLLGFTNNMDYFKTATIKSNFGGFRTIWQLSKCLCVHAHMDKTRWYASWSLSLLKTPQIAESAWSWAACTETLPFVLLCKQKQPDSPEMIRSPLSHNHTWNCPLLFSSATLYSTRMCVHRDARPHMQKRTQIYNLSCVSLPHSLIFLRFFSPCMPFSHFSSLTAMMVNPSWISGGYHHGDGAPPHVSLDPPAGYGAQSEVVHSLHLQNTLWRHKCN